MLIRKTNQTIIPQFDTVYTQKLNSYEWLQSSHMQQPLRTFHLQYIPDDPHMMDWQMHPGVE